MGHALIDDRLLVDKNGDYWAQIAPCEVLKERFLFATICSPIREK
jgi:hypothetical protein